MLVRKKDLEDHQRPWIISAITGDAIPYPVPGKAVEIRCDIVRWLS
jgi:hypothetical protein